MKTPILIQSVDSLILDGKPMSLVLALTTHPADAADIQDALRLYEARLLTAAQSGVEVAKTCEAELVAKLRATHETHVAALAERDAQIDDLSSQCSRLIVTLDDLKAEQAVLVDRAAGAIGKLQSVAPPELREAFDGLLAVLKDAQTPLLDRKIAELAAKKQSLLDAAAAVDAQIEDLSSPAAAEK